MATATKTRKGKGAANGVPAAEIDPGPSQAAQDLSKRLADFGFVVPLALIHQWEATTFTTVARTVEQWMDEFATAATVNSIPEEDRTIVPPLLKNFEVVDEMLTKFAETHARGVAEKFGDKPEAVNPYPPETLVGKIWADALLKAVGVKSGDETKPADGETPDPNPDGTAEDPETTATSPESSAANPEAKPAEAIVTTPTPAAVPAQVVQSNHADAAELNARRAEESRQKRLNQQRLAIEGAQMELEEAASHQADLEDEVKSIKADLKEKKAAFDNAGEQVRAASRKLQRAREGWFDPNVLPFGKGPQNHPELNVPDADIGASRPESAPSPEASKPAIDEGAFIPLDNLVVTVLHEYLAGAGVTVDPKLGISAKQCEELKKIVGDTIGSLEKWQKENGGGEWWRKTLKDKGVGLGGAACDKLVEAHEAIRRKYPIPSPDEPSPETAPAGTGTTDSPPSFTAEEAIERLKKLQTRAVEVAETCENDQGVDFLTSVEEEAAKRQATIEKTGVCTPDQASAIANWEAGVEGWSDGTAADSDEDEVEFGDGLDSEDLEEADIDESDLDEDLDVPDEDGGDE